MTITVICAHSGNIIWYLFKQISSMLHESCPVSSSNELYMYSCATFRLNLDLTCGHYSVTSCYSSCKKKYDIIWRRTHFVSLIFFRCVICMGDFSVGEQLRILPCMHSYHKDCIDDWLMRSFTCPSCMEPVDAALLTTYETSQ